MTVRRTLRRAASAVAALAAGAALLIGGQTAAQAATPAAAHKAGPAAGTAVTAPSGVAGSFTLRPVAHNGKVAPNTVFGCTVGYPLVTTTYATATISWSAGISCTISLHMVGTTAFYPWGSNTTWVWGTQYNNIASSNTSTGQASASTGLWGVNHNVDIYIPAGYTTSVAGGCAFVNSSQIHCTVTTGPVDAQRP
jgi:hypothetical protein